MKWFSREWWAYLLAKRKRRDRKYCSRWSLFWCRVRNHPAGVIWYDASGDEPDMHCQNCGEDLG
jgi:hypothetical protein